MNDVERSQRIYDAAFDYLLSFDQVDEKILTRHLNDWQYRDAESLTDVYRQCVFSAQNRQAMPNSIGDVDALAPLLEGFSSSKVLARYDSWEAFFRAVESSDEVSPPAEMDIENKRSHWVQYSKSVLSAARFLDQFDDIESFEAFVDDFSTSEYTRYSLALLIAEQVHGFGFALGCDFLKELGYPQFVKPDIHLKTIFTELDLTDGDSDFEIFLDIIRFADRIDEPPFRVDKLFWLVGSGRFHRADPAFGVTTDRDGFIGQQR